MIISLSLIPGVMVGFEWVTDEVDDDSSTSFSSYIVFDLFIIRMLVEY